MEGPLEVKDSGPAMDKPIKSEGVAQSPDSSERSNGATSPPPNCSICLGKLVNTSFTDSCLHQFCFTCLLQWSKIKTECPLCKQTFKSIIHNVRSEEDYDQYHVPRELASQIPQPPQLIDNGLNIFELDANWDLGDSSVRRFFYRTTMTPNRRRQMLLNPEQVARREQIPSVAPQVPREERRRRRANPMEYRRGVYRLGTWAAALPDVFGHFRECSAEYYRRQPRELDRLVPWLTRELEAILNNASDAAYVMREIMDALIRHDIRNPQFRDSVRRHLGGYTEQFLHELLTYARTNFDLVGYDQSVIYLPQGLSNEYVSRVVSPATSSSSTTSDDSDVRVLDEAIDLRVNTEMPSVGPHAFNMPGPSTVGQAFQLEMPYNVPDVLTISSNSSSGSSDECQVIDYVKPRHARTPEIIVLLSSDPEDASAAVPAVENTEVPRSSYGETPQPSTSESPSRRKVKTKVKEISTSTASDSDSDSGNSSKWSRHYQSRAKCSSKRSSTSVRRRKRSTGGRGRNRGASRNQSTSEDSDVRKRSSKRSSCRSRKRPSSSNDSSYDPGRSIDEGRIRRRSYSTRSSAGRVHTDLKKWSNRFVDDSSSSDSSSDSDSDTKKCRRSRAQRKSKKKYSSSSTSDTRLEKAERLLTRSKEKSRQAVDGMLLKDIIKKEKLRDRRSRSRSSSTSSSYDSAESSRKQRGSEEGNTSTEYGTQDDSNSVNTDLSRCSNANRAGSSTSSSDSDDERNGRSSSQCSSQSRRLYVHRKRSKHKERCKGKGRKRSDSRTFNSFQSMSSEGTLSSVKSESLPRHSDSKSQSNSSKSSSSRHKSRRGHKDSKHRRSQSDSKSKSKKKRRRVRSSSSSNFELC